MIIVVTNRWTNTSKTYPAQSGLYARHLERIVNRYRNNLPKSFSRHRRSRQYCVNVDVYIQNLLNSNSFWLSNYAGKQYIVKVVDTDWIQPIRN